MLPISAQAYSTSMTSMSTGIISPPSSIGLYYSHGLRFETSLTLRIGPNNSRAIDFPYQHDRSNWENQLNEHGPLSAGPPYADDHAHRHWRGSPITPGYSPYTTGPAIMLPQQTHDAGSNFQPFGASRPGPGWPIPAPAPARSMSIGDFSHTYPQNNFQQPYPIDTRRRASDMHPPSLHNSAHSSNASISDASGPPMSAPLASQVMHQFPFPHWNIHPGQSPMTKMSEFGNWYSDPVQLAKVQEEEAASHFGGEPAMLYSSAGH